VNEYIIKENNNRNTIQKELVLDALHKLNHPTAEEIYLFIKNQHTSVSKATVYRNLNLLVSKGEVLRIPTVDLADHFDHTSYRHCHAQCNGCGSVYDLKLDIQFVDDLKNQIEDNYGFDVISQEIIFTGLCKECRS